MMLISTHFMQSLMYTHTYTHTHKTHTPHIIREELRLESEQLVRELKEARRRKDEEGRDLAKQEAGEYNTYRTYRLGTYAM